MINTEPKINPNIKNLSVSPTLRINQKMQKLQAQGEELTHFGFGQSPFPAPALLEQALQACATQNTYLPTQGLPDLRDSIAQWMGQAFNIETHSQQIFIGPGSKECIFDLLYLLEGTVLIPQGSWVSYKPMTAILGKPHKILSSTFEDKYCLQPDVLDEVCAQTEGQKILILNSPNNPTGQVFSKDLLESLAEVCRKHEVIVISDEIYGLVQFENKPYSSIQHFYPEGTIVTNGLSKAFSAGGFRLGFACLPENFSGMFGSYNTMISETYSAVASPIQYAAVSVFRQFDKIMPYVKKCNQIHQKVLEATYRELTSVGYRANPAQGGFYLLFDLQSFANQLKVKNIHTGAQLCDHLLESYGVGLLPGHEFGFEQEFLGFRLSPVDFEGSDVLPIFSQNMTNSEFVNYLPRVKRGLDQLKNFVHSLNQ